MTDIGDLALLSDFRTAAMVDREGTVSWWCPGRFDRPSVFTSSSDDTQHTSDTDRTDDRSQTERKHS